MSNYWGKIKVIAFDLDDTLWEMRPVLIRAEEKLSAYLTQTFPQLKYDVISMRELRYDVLKEAPELAHRVTAFRHRLIEKAMSMSGMSDEEAKEGASLALNVFLAARSDVTFFDDVLSTLALLSQEYTLGSLTNGNADIKRLGLNRYFQFSFSAEDVGARKPAPDLFHQAVQYTGVAAEEMVYVGDDLIQDVEAANRAGLHSIWVNRKQHELPQDMAQTSSPHATVKRIDQIPDVLTMINVR